MSASDETRDEKGGFLTRWSARKQAAKSEPVENPVVSASLETTVPDAVQDEAEFDLSSLPNLDDLTGESDLSVFLQKGVPDSIRNAAMRKVWALDPVITGYVGPVDYAWDFNDPLGVPGFGPLDMDVDVASLLKQVMGDADPEQNSVAALKKLPEPDSSLRRHDKPVLLAPDHQPVALLPDVAENPEHDARSVASDDGSDEEAPQISPRKRHGGAVPI